ncbi:MAG: ArnT family glycosyltransferase [Tepidisphaeraceae bacterium]
MTVAAGTLPLDRAGTREVALGWAGAVLIAAVTFLSSLPMLSWLEFSNSMENLIVGTVLEIRRGGPLLVPTLEGVPRIEKPPLTAWITALGVRGSTMARLDDPDPAVRRAAYDDLAFDVRWTALVASCLSLLPVFALGKTCADTRTGLIAAGVCATTYYFLRFSIHPTTDVQLMLWVATANALLAKIVLDGVTIGRALGAGAAVGLAFMSKGPVSFVHTLIPAAAFVAWRAWCERRWTWRGLPALLAGLVVMLVVALWWFIVAGIGDPSIIPRWLRETNPGGADRLRSGNPFVYLIIIPFSLPWTLFMLDGVVRAIRATRQAGRDAPRSVRMTYPVILLLLSLLVMSCFRDRKDRYLLPIIGVAAVVAAHSVTAMLDRRPRSVPMSVHFATLVVMALLPLVGTTTWILQTRDAEPWYTPAFAALASASGLAIVALGVVLARRWRAGAVVAGVALMLYLHAVGIRGYRLAREGRSEFRAFAELVRQTYPDAHMFNTRTDGVKQRASVDLSIYLNRVTRWSPDPASLPPDPTRPQICLVLRKAGDSEPNLGGEWRWFHTIARDRNQYLAFVRLPSP